MHDARECVEKEREKERERERQRERESERERARERTRGDYNTVAHRVHGTFPGPTAEHCNFIHQCDTVHCVPRGFIHGHNTTNPITSQLQQKR